MWDSRSPAARGSEARQPRRHHRTSQGV